MQFNPLIFAASVGTHLSNGLELGEALRLSAMHHLKECEEVARAQNAIAVEGIEGKRPPSTLSEDFAEAIEMVMPVEPDVEFKLTAKNLNEALETLANFRDRMNEGDGK